MEALACTEFGGVRTLDLCRCRWSRSSFELDRCKHAKRRVSALAVVEDLEVVKSLPGPAVGGEGGGVSVQLCLEQPHDRFSHRIVEAVADGPDRGGGTYLVDPFGVEDRGVLTSGVGVADESVQAGVPPGPGGHVEGVDHESCGHGTGGLPADQ